MTDGQIDYRATVLTAEEIAQAARQMALSSKVAWIVDVVVTYNSVVALNLAPRTATFTVAGPMFGDRVYVHRNGVPKLSGVNVVAGIILESTGFVPSDGKVEVYHVIPAVGLGQILNIPLRLVGQRPAIV